jgi:hypothetical protein
MVPDLSLMAVANVQRLGRITIRDCRYCQRREHHGQTGGLFAHTAYYRPVRRKPLLSGLRNFGLNRETLMPLPFCYMPLATSMDHSRVPAT